ncbi:uncharacterized protein LAJ45_04238 [Morchella importuna]|uniref:uncharacterized protein n=1 Tax=Morchella importuna TaxID=1174673 RepID=UPI001E8EA1A7|nr:uncharacterized protein LAJ45_04238 [Morchella importuna]KAH8151616.1 hypothetical protein LAJ45_04238 [Morchella importuna]
MAQSYATTTTTATTRHEWADLPLTMKCRRLWGAGRRRAVAPPSEGIVSSDGFKPPPPPQLQVPPLPTNPDSHPAPNHLPRVAVGMSTLRRTQAAGNYRRQHPTLSRHIT